jgi:hypothetical protein
MPIRKLVFLLLLSASILLAYQSLSFADPCDCYEPWTERPSQPSYIGGCSLCLVFDIENPGGCDYLVYEYDLTPLLFNPYYPDTTELHYRDLVSKFCQYFSGVCASPPCPETVVEFHTSFYYPCTVPCP